MISHGYYTRVKDQQYRAAGVLPFAIAPSGQVLILLGRERGWGPRSHMLRWKDFGGHRESIDEDAEATAAREFSEETLGLFGGPEVATCSIAASSSAMRAHLRSSGRVFRVDAPLRNGGNYCMFVARVAYIEPLLFNLAAQENAVTKGVEGAEKCGFIWVEAKRLLAAIDAEEAENMRSAVAKAHKKKEATVCNFGRGVPGKMVAGEGKVSMNDGVVNDSTEECSAGGGSAKDVDGERVFRRSVVAVMVKGAKPSPRIKSAHSKSKADLKLLLHSSFVGTLRRAQAGGLLEFLLAASQGGGPVRQLPINKVAEVGGKLGSVLGKRKGRVEREGPRKKRRMSSECLMYWIMHAKKIGALEGSLGAERCDATSKGKRTIEEVMRSPGTAEPGQDCGVGPRNVGQSSSHQNSEWARPMEIQTGGSRVAEKEGCRGVAQGERGYLEVFAPEHRSTVAGAFHEAARQGATDAAALVESVLVRAALKAELPRPIFSPAMLLSGPQAAAPLNLPLLQLTEVGKASSVAPPASFTQAPSPPFEPRRRVLGTEMSTASLVHTDRPLVARAAAPPSVNKTVPALGGSSHVHRRTGTAEAVEETVHGLRDENNRVGGQNGPSEGYDDPTQKSCPLGRRCTDQKVTIVSGRSESWEVYARRYAQASSGIWPNGERPEEGGAEICRVVTEGARTAATAWIELEQQLRFGPQEGAIAYAMSVIEWGSLGDAEKKRRKRRRRSAQSRK